MLDPAPRVMLDPDLGVVTIGRSAQDAAIAFDVYQHTIDIVLRATALGGYRALPAADIFAVEYWDLEQAKLRRGWHAAAVRRRDRAGHRRRVGHRQGHASRRSCARGAAVVGAGHQPGCGRPAPAPGFPRRAVRREPAEAISNEPRTRRSRPSAAWTCWSSTPAFSRPASRIEALPLAEWRQRDARSTWTPILPLLESAHPLLKCAPRGGRVVVIGSKNVPAPGPGAAAYSASKAALTQLARVAALEWGADGIRVNVVHPNAVFDTGIWTEDGARSARRELRPQRRGVQDATTCCAWRSPAGTWRSSRPRCAGRSSPGRPARRCPIDGGNERVI